MVRGGNLHWRRPAFLDLDQGAAQTASCAAFAAVVSRPAQDGADGRGKETYGLTRHLKGIELYVRVKGPPPGLKGHTDMHAPYLNRRNLILGGAAATLAATGGLIAPTQAATYAPTETMRGGSNNYRPNAPLVDKLGAGFFVRGKVLKAGAGEPLPNVRIQIWAATTLGGEREPCNHGSVLTREDGAFELEMMQIVPNFGQPHAHLAYDDGAYRTVFLRPVMPSARDASVTADFVLAPA